MGLFGSNTKKEAKERLKWLRETDGEVAEAVKQYNKKSGGPGIWGTDKEDVRRTAARKDSFFAILMTTTLNFNMSNCRR